MPICPISTVSLTNSSNCFTPTGVIVSSVDLVLAVLGQDSADIKVARMVVLVQEKQIDNEF